MKKETKINYLPAKRGSTEWKHNISLMRWGNNVVQPKNPDFKACLVCKKTKHKDEMATIENGNKCLLCKNEQARNYYRKNKDKVLQNYKRRRQKDKEKYSARSKVKYAVESGKLTRPIQCGQCEASGVRINAHHEDYTKPLDVLWVCDTCHRKIHRKKREQEKIGVN